MRVLAGDIGGTHTRLMLAEVSGTRVRALAERRYSSRGSTGLEPLLDRFLGYLADHRLRAPEAAGFGIAGPVEDDRVKVTNLPWVLDARTLGERIGCPTCLVNDFVATGFGVLALDAADVLTLQPGTPDPAGVIAVIGAGTGLGHALVLRDEGRVRVLPSEAGHTGFAPADAEQAALLGFLVAETGRATWEQVVSGPGFGNILRFLRAGGAVPGKDLENALIGGDAAAAISAAALDGRDPVAVRALDLFVRAYGSRAGDFALTCLPRGGLYLAGGIAPRILPALTDGALVAAFTAKAPMMPLLRTIPIHVVMNENTGLLGAALAAVSPPSVPAD